MDSELEGDKAVSGGPPPERTGSSDPARGTSVVAQDAVVVGNVEGVQPGGDPQLEAGQHWVAAGEDAGGGEEMLDEPRRPEPGQLVERREAERHHARGYVVEEAGNRAEL
jgi:hypothetical protein